MHPLLRYRQALMAVIFAITLFFAWGMTRLGISFSFQSFYPKDDAEFAYYEHYQTLFTEDQNFINYVAVSPEGGAGIWDSAFLARASDLFEAIAELPGMDSALTATNFPELSRRGMSIRQRPFLRYQTPEELADSRQRALADSTFFGNFITREGSHLCGFFFIEPAIFDSRERDQLSHAMDSLLQAQPLPFVISGIPYIRTQYVEKIGKELLLFTSLAVLLITVVLFLTYRNLWGILIPPILIFLALIWTLGMMGWTGQDINIINNLLIPIMFVVGMSDIIHMFTKYFQELRDGRSKEDAVRVTLKEIGLSLFLTSFTTAIGFASLYVSRVPPIREFGVSAAVGVILTYFISIVLIPGILIRLPEKAFVGVRSLENAGIWERLLLWVERFTKRRPRFHLVFWGVLIGLSLVLIQQIPVDVHLIEDIGKRDPVRQSMEFFEESSYGLRPFELGFQVKGSSRRLDDLELLRQMSAMEHYLGKDPQFSPFLSLPSFLEEANGLLTGNKRLPDTQEEVDQLIALTYQQGQQELLSRLISPDGREARITARMPDIGNVAYEALSARLDSFVVASCDTSLFSYQSTGHAYLTEQNLKYVRRSLLGGLSLAFVMIGLTMGLLFRSWRMLIISLLPNVIPLLLTGGVMGLFGITLTASTALVFVIAFGIAVDDTIHFLNRYRMERKRGLSVDQAISVTIMGTGKAMTLTSFVLMGGFVLLLASDFGGTFNTGLFTALTIVFALLADLLLLPVLVRWIDR